MRYFEIVKPSARHIAADTGPREVAAEERRTREMKAVGASATANSVASPDLINRPSRRWHLSPRRSQWRKAVFARANDRSRPSLR
jgi:hypothetical protein